MAEKKAAHSSKPTSDYLKIVESYHDPDKQETINRKTGHKVSKFNDSIDNFFFGDEAKEKKEAGAAKKLKKGDRAEAQNLVHKVVVDHIKRAHGDKLAKQYEGNPELIKAYINGLGVTHGYESMVSQIASLGKGANIEALLNPDDPSELYRAISAMAKKEVKEHQDYEEAKSALNTDKHIHHDKVVDWHHKKTGLRHKISNDIDQIITDYSRWVRNDERYGKKFVETQAERFHKNTVDKYQKTHYAKEK